MFPILYHAHHKRYQEDLPFWLELATHQGYPVLELGCGSGRVLNPLAQAGHCVYGLDNDPDMLDVLRDNITPELLPRTHIFVADFTSFHLELRFPLIILPCNTYSTLSNRGRRTTLACVHRHLRSGGIFATSLPNPRLLEQVPPCSEPEVEDTFPHPLDGEPVQVSSTWERTPQHFTVHWHYDHLAPDGSVERISTQVRHNLVTLQTYFDEIDQAGLQIANIFGDFDKDPYSEETPFLILILARL